MRIPVLPIVFLFTILILTTVLGVRFIGNDGHSELSVEKIGQYLPGEEFQTADCDELTIIGQYYDNNDSFYYCTITVDNDSILYVNLIMDAYRIIHYTHFNFKRDVVELDDFLYQWPGRPEKRYKFRLYGYITYDNIHITTKRRDSGLGYAIISVSIYSLRERLS